MLLMAMSRLFRENAKRLFLSSTFRLLIRGKCKTPVLSELLLSPWPASSLCPSSTVGDLREPVRCLHSKYYGWFRIMNWLILSKQGILSLLKGRDRWKKVSDSPATEGGIRSAPDTQQENRAWVLCYTFFLSHL